MKTLNYLLLAVIAVCLASCSSKKGDESFDVTVDNTVIGGKLSQYFTLEEKTYKYKTGLIDEVTVELKCKEPLPENLNAYIGVDVLDENGTVIATGTPDAFSFNDSDILHQATPGQTVTVKIENHNNIGDEKPAKIRLSSVVEENDNEEGLSSGSDGESVDEEADASESDDADSYSSSTGSEDWDALLNSYEEYVDKYISYMKKAAKGDMSALAEYPSLLEKAQEFSEKMENAQGDMSASQWARYMKITKKMANAAK